MKNSLWWSMKNENCAGNNGTGIKSVKRSWKDEEGKYESYQSGRKKRGVFRNGNFRKIKQQRSSRLLFLLLCKKVLIARLTLRNVPLSPPISLLSLKHSQSCCAAHRAFHPNFSIISMFLIGIGVLVVYVMWWYVKLLHMLCIAVLRCHAVLWYVDWVHLWC